MCHSLLYSVRIGCKLQQEEISLGFREERQVCDVIVSGRAMWEVQESIGAMQQEEIGDNQYSE